MEHEVPEVSLIEDSDQNKSIPCDIQEDKTKEATPVFVVGSQRSLETDSL